MSMTIFIQRIQVCLCVDLVFLEIKLYMLQYFLFNDLFIILTGLISIYFLNSNYPYRRIELYPLYAIAGKFKYTVYIRNGRKYKGGGYFDIFILVTMQHQSFSSFCTKDILMQHFCCPGIK